MLLETLLLQVHLLATAALAGLVWTVQLASYPAFRAVGPTPGWPAYHRRHTTALSLLVPLPWALQGLALGGLLLLRPGPLVVLAAGLAAAAVAVTAALSVPLHSRLARGYDDAVARRLIATSWLRTAAWTAGTACAAVLAVQGAS